MNSRSTSVVFGCVAITFLVLGITSDGQAGVWIPIAIAFAVIAGGTYLRGRG